MSVGITQLRALVAVVEEGSFSLAATRLGISQSAVSHAMASLERATGHPVLTRNGSPPRPTPLGELILEHARSAVAAVRAVEDISTRREGQPRGKVVLAAPPTVANTLIPALLHRWGLEFPGVAVSLFEGEDDEVTTWLDTSVADLAVLVDPAGKPAGSVVLHTDVFHAALGADHPLAAQEEVGVTDLADDPFLLSTGGCERHIREMHRRAGQPITPVHRVRQLSTLFAMVRAGIGVSIVPGLAASITGPDVVLVPVLPKVHRTLLLTGPLHRPWHPAIAALIGTSTVD